MRRLARLNTIPIYKNKGEDALIIYLEDALSVFLEYTHRSEDPGDLVDSLVCDIAKFKINKEGAEGMKMAADGEMKRDWGQEIGLPSELTARMKMYRRVVGSGASPRI